VAKMKRAQCSNCAAEARIVRGDYEFKETGLRDLVLLGIELIKCGKCGNVDPVLFQVDELMHIAAVAILQKPYRLGGEELRFLRKHIDLSQEEFARLLRVNKTTLSKWENNEDPIGIQSDLWARTVVMSRDKRLEKRAADHIRTFGKMANKQKRVRVEVDTQKHEYAYA
jgi:transcriptional regulator with XRE-family HTH domain